MIANLQPYPEYKELALPWLGRLPSHWGLRRNGGLFLQRNETDFPDLPILEVAIKSGVKVRDLENGARKQVMTDRRKYKRALCGDIAYNMMRMWQGATGRVPVDGLVSPAYVVARPLSGTESRYFELLFRTPTYQSEVNNASRGIVSDRNRLYWPDFKQLFSPLPPPEEQSAIVRFLDYANGRLERAIRSKRKVIALLHEQKQAIIHRAVTRGLDPTVPLKPSGIPWLGDIPKHWEVVTVGTAMALIQTGPFGSQLHSHEYVAGGTPVINPSHMENGRIVASREIAIRDDKLRELERHKLSEGDIVAARRGELGRCALVTSAEEGWICGTGSLLLRCKPSMFLPTYFQRVFSSQWVRDSLNLSSIGATMANLNAGMVARLRMPLPPKEEQENIVSFIEAKNQNSDTAIQRLEREIALLREYRTRLVADVVTGKLDVRTAARHLPAESLVPEDAVPEEFTEPELEEIEA
ncbi:MAG: restriction endonuclease subunit S [Terrimicrobiaceae bacterium]